MKGFVRSVLPHSAVDGPGNRVVVFFQGCQFKCRYCHNPETIPYHAVGSPFERTVEDVVAMVKPYLDYTSGVTFSGGECTTQPEFLEACCKALKALGVHILIDTNGDMPVSICQQLAEVVDGFMVDLKALDNEKHIALTGTGNARVKQNLLELNARGRLFEIRLVVVPQMSDPEETLDWLSQEDMKHIRIKLIKYRAHGVTEAAKDLKSPSPAHMTRLYEYAKALGFENVIIV